MCSGPKLGTSDKLPLPNLRPHPPGDQSCGRTENRGLKMIHHRPQLDSLFPRRSLVVRSAGSGGGLLLSLSLNFGETVGANAESFAPNAFIRIGTDGLIIL